MANVLCVGHLNHEGVPISSFLIKSNHEVNAVDTLEEALTEVSRPAYQYHVVLLDGALEEKRSAEAVKLIRQANMLVEIILYLDKSSLPLAISAMKNGAFRVEIKPVLPELVLKHVENIENNFDLFEKIETGCRDRLTDQMDYRLILATEFIQKRRQEGHLITHEDLQLFLPLQDEKNSAITEIFQEQLYNEKKQLPFTPTLLIVEDEPSLRQVLTMIFTAEKYKVLVADSGKKATEHCQNSDYKIDVALLDIGLPDTTGDKLISIIKDHHIDAEVVMLTAFKELNTIFACFEKKAVDYVVKPFINDELVRTVGRALQRSYFKRFLPNMGHMLDLSFQFSETEKMSILKEIVEFRSFLGKPILLKDIYFFFPKLRSDWNLPEDFLVDSKHFKRGVPGFIKGFYQELQKQLSEEPVENYSD